MTQELIRTYHPAGTNGCLCLNGEQICATIELPWKNNAHRISCIPEGAYRLIKRWSPKFGQHLWLQDVPGRTLILIHPANNAARELEGCIAPVLSVTGAGQGVASRTALKKLLQIYEARSKKEKVWLKITKASMP